MREPLNPRLIRLVASQYRELQGLRTMAQAAVPMAFGAWLALAQSWWHLLLAVPVAVAWGWLYVTWINERIDDFYDSRCGRVGWRSLPLSHTFLFMSLAQGSALMSWHFAGAAFLLANFTLYPAFAVVRDAPYRLYWIVPLLVGVVAGVQFAALTTASQAEAWMIRVALTGGVAIAIAGLGDHLLLMRTLPAGFRLKAETTDSRA